MVLLDWHLANCTVYVLLALQANFITILSFRYQSAWHISCSGCFVSYGTRGVCVCVCVCVDHTGLVHLNTSFSWKDLLTQWQVTFAGVCFCSYPCHGNTRGNRSTTAKESVVTVAQPLTDLEGRAMAGPLTLWSDLTISKHAFVCVCVCVCVNVCACVCSSKNIAMHYGTHVGYKTFRMKFWCWWKIFSFWLPQ